MSPTRVVWSGLTEYRQQIQELPQTCTTEAANVITAEVNAAYVSISRVYGQHRLTGTLQRRLQIQPLKVKGEATTGKVLRSGSPLAWLFDHGSQARHYVTKSGRDHRTGRMWGRTPPTHIFTQTTLNAKRAIIAELKARMARRATAVAGDGDIG